MNDAPCSGRGRLPRALGVLFILVALAGPAVRQPAVAAAQSDDDGLNDAFTELWTFETGDTVKPDPVVAEGVVFVPSLDGVVHAVDTATGEELWQAPHSEMSSLATNAGMVFTREFDYETERGRLVARNIADGVERWAFETEDGFESTSLTIAADEDIMLVYVTRGEAPAGEPFVVLVALDLSDGTERWRRDSTAAVAYDDGVAYAIHADVDGHIVLDVTSGEELGVTNDRSGTLYQDGVFYSYRESDGGLKAVEAETGDELWRVPLDDAAEMTLFHVNAGALYFTENRDDGVTLMAFDLERQETRWVVDELPGGRLSGLAFDGERAIVALEWDSPELPGGLVVLETGDGDTVAQANIPEFGADSMAFADGVIYVGEWKMLRALAFDATAASGQSDDGDAAATLDLAAMTLTPSDLEDAGLDDYGLGYGETILLDAVAANTALYRDLPEEDVAEILGEAGFVRTYRSYLYLPADEDDPAGPSDRYVLSYVLEFVDADGAEAAWAFLEDESDDETAEDLDEVAAFGDQSEATRQQGEDEAGGDPFDALDLTVRLANLHAGLTIVDWTGEEPDLDDAEALADLLLERVEATRDGDAPGLGSQVARLSGDDVVPATDYYTIRDGEALALYGETAADAEARAEAGADIGQTDRYSLQQQIPIGDGDEGWYLVDIQRFEDEDAATEWLDGTEDRLAANDDFEDVEVDEDAPAFGDESLAFTAESADFAYRSVSLRVGTVVANIDVLGPETPPADAVVDLAEAQAACLEDGGCPEPIPLPNEFGVAGDEGDDADGLGGAGDDEEENGRDDDDRDDDGRDDDDRDDEEESGDDESGSSATTGGDSYVSPTWGYTIAWDPETWVVTEAEPDDGIEYHIMGSVLVAGSVAGIEGFDGDPEDCLTGMVGASESDSPLVESDDVPAPETAEDAVGGIYALGDFAVVYFECRPLVEGEAVLQIRFAAPVGDYEAALPALEELLAGIEVN